jgi:surfactin synthase thioesterase subunit
MVDRWVVIGGWGVDPRVLKPLFGTDTLLLNSTRIAESLIHDRTLVPDWKDALADLIVPLLPDKPFGIAGWSTGAIMAWTLAKIVPPAAVVCLSATPSFCRRPGFSHGQHPSMLRTMRKKMADRPAEVLESFYRECGLTNTDRPAPETDLPISSLIAGLHFLEQASLFPFEKPDTTALFLHGRQDAVIPSAAGRYFSDQTGGIFEEFDGPHAFFDGHPADVRSVITRYSRDLDL